MWRFCLRVLAGGIEVRHRHLEVVRHAAEEDVLAGAETAGEQFFSVVPLAGGEGFVALIAEQFGEHDERPAVGRGGQLRAHDAAIDVEQGLAGHEHGAAGRADRADGSAHDAGLGEGGSGAGQAVHGGGADFGVVEGVEGAEALVVGEEEEDVGAVFCRALGGAEGGGGRGACRSSSAGTVCGWLMWS